MLSCGSRIKILTSSNKRGSVKAGATAYVVNALFQPTMSCLLIESIVVKEKPEHKFMVVDLGLTKSIRHKLINGYNIFKVANGLYVKNSIDAIATEKLSRATLESLLVNLSLPQSLNSHAYLAIATKDSIKFPLVTFNEEPTNLFFVSNEEFLTWLKAVVLGLNNIIIYSKTLFKSNINAPNADQQYRETLTILLNKYFTNQVFEVAWLDGRPYIMLTQQRLNVASRSKLCLDLQQFKASFYPIIIEYLMNKYRRCLLEMPALSIRVGTILSHLTALRKYTLNYEAHNREFYDHYYYPKMHQLLEILISCLYNDMLPTRDRLSFIITIIKSKTFAANIPEVYLKARLDKFSLRRFNKAALARFYELS